MDHFDNGSPYRNRPRFWLELTLAAFAVLGIAFFLSHKPSHFKLPSCVFHDLTGLYCPGCGCTRALTRLVRGDVSGAFRNNPTTIPGFLVCAYLFALRLKTFWNGREPNWGAVCYVGLATCFTLVVFTVLRNIPLEALDFLRPLKQ